MRLKAAASAAFQAKQDARALQKKKGPSDYQLVSLHNLQGEADIKKNVVRHSCVNLSCYVPNFDQEMKS